MQFVSLRGLLQDLNTGPCGDGKSLLITDALRERLADLLMEEMFNLASEVANARARDLYELHIKTMILSEYLEPDDRCIVEELARSLCDDIKELASEQALSANSGKAAPNLAKGRRTHRE